MYKMARREILHHFGNFDLLRADLFAAAAADAGAWPFVLRQGAERHGRDEPAARKAMLVVQLDDLGDVQLTGTVARAIAARRAGQDGFFVHVFRHAEKEGALLFRERLFLFKRGDVVLDLFEIGHPGEDHLDFGNAEKEAERPGRDAFIGAQGLQKRLIFGRERRQLAAPQRLHDPDGNVPFFQKFHLVFRVLETPVDIVYLQLAEFHVLPVLVQKPPDDGQGAVRGKAEMADAPVFLLLFQVGENAVALVQIGVDVHLADVVEEVEIEMVRAALFQLRFENLLHFVDVPEIVAGELGGEIKAVPRVCRKNLAHGVFRFAVVIPPGGVEIIDPVPDGIVEHLRRRLFVDLCILPVQNGQTHRAESERGQLYALKISVNHIFNLRCFIDFSIEYTLPLPFPFARRIRRKRRSPQPCPYPFQPAFSERAGEIFPSAPSVSPALSRRTMRVAAGFALSFSTMISPNSSAQI